MAIPQSCTVLVVGGGPAGSYAAAALAREGIDTVLLEADNFPRYHIGESTLPSLRHFFKFIDFYDTFDAHGFYRKPLHSPPDGRTGRWDEQKAFQGRPGRPVSATWVRKNGSGRQGLLSMKYMTNRKFNENFKSVHGPGTNMEDASGWVWFMPVADNIRSVGIVHDKKMATAKKQQLGRPATEDFYKHCLKRAPGTNKLLSGAELTTNIKSASDWSYTASTYHLPHARICGDEGSFIDPLFSSDVHLAVTGGLSAAATIAALIRGDCDERTVGAWHSKKTVTSYTRFFLAVSSATKQIRQQHEPIIQDMDEEGFQRAFDLLRPSMNVPRLISLSCFIFELTTSVCVQVTQGTVDADTTGAVDQTDFGKIFEFCFKAFTYVPPQKKEALFQKIEALGIQAGQLHTPETLEAIGKHLTGDELQVLETLRSRRMVRENPFEMDSFTLDTIDGMAPSLVRGKLGLTHAEPAKVQGAHFWSPKFLDGKAPGIREGSVHLPTSKIQLG
ncbi:hypothetical protein BJX62DRAFT_227482 [Aspergillus germanicus]